MAGTFLGSCQVAWYPDPVTSDAGMGGVVGKTDVRAVARAVFRPALWMAAAGAAFAAVECFAAEARQKNDSWNSVMGGMAAGAVIGATTKRFDLMTSSAMGFGLLIGILDYSGPDTVRDPFELKSKMYDVLPATHKESEAIKGLKEKYPKFKNL